MEAVLGVAPKGGARASFLKHVESRSRRVQSGHDRAYAIFDCFGSWQPETWWDSTEEFCLQQIRDVVVPEQQQDGCDYDFYTIELWRDIAGDIFKANPQHYPTGFGNIRDVLHNNRIDVGLWVTASLATWTIGDNPAIKPCYAYDSPYGNDLGWLCMASEPLRTMFTDAFLRHIRENKMKLLKLDGLSSICYNPHHEHLPGVYSTEAIDDAMIAILNRLNSDEKGLFVMLYWGSRSPWWLLHADTLFESGLEIEAASPSGSPTLYVRDSVTVGLDQAQWYCCDVPRLGKDSLGVWLADWGWNSHVGKERWQEGFVMDICRGSAMAQPWSDDGSLSSAERRQMGDFIQLLKKRYDCFRNSRPILGNPWKNEPYGYACSNGKRAFLALNNCTWDDRTIDLQLNSKWGLPDGKKWDLYRWYPDPAMLSGGGLAIALRPFEVDLFEVVPRGEPPSLDRLFEERRLHRAFSTASKPVEETISDAPADQAVAVPREGTKRTVRITCSIPPSPSGGTLVVLAEAHQGDRAAAQGDIAGCFGATATISGTDISCQPIIPRCSFASPWQGWRIPVAASSESHDTSILVSTVLPPNVEIRWSVRWVPE